MGEFNVVMGCYGLMTYGTPTVDFLDLPFNYDSNVPPFSFRPDKLFLKICFWIR